MHCIPRAAKRYAVRTLCAAAVKERRLGCGLFDENKVATKRLHLAGNGLGAVDHGHGGEYVGSVY